MMNDCQQYVDNTHYFHFYVLFIYSEIVFIQKSQPYLKDPQLQGKLIL